MPPPILDIARVNYSSEERLKWDKNIKSYDLININNNNNDINKIEDLTTQTQKMTFQKQN